MRVLQVCALACCIRGTSAALSVRNDRRAGARTLTFGDGSCGEQRFDIGQSLLLWLSTRQSVAVKKRNRQIGLERKRVVTGFSHLRSAADGESDHDDEADRDQHADTDEEGGEVRALRERVDGHFLSLATAKLSRMVSIFVLNGPNLGRLGSREPDVYGSGTLDDLRVALDREAPPGHAIDLRQTNDEAELISWLYEAVDTASPVILNPAAFTHYSYALRDAAALVTTAGLILVEVHISNPHAREEFRHNSVISGVATGVIAGFGFDSYLLALDAINRKLG